MERPGAATEGLRVGPGLLGTAHRGDEERRLGIGEERAVDAIADDLGRTAASERDDGRTRCERLGTHDPEVVFGREDEAARRAEELLHGRVVDATGECDVVVGDLLERRALASLTDDDEPHADLVERADRDIDVLVRGEPRNNEPEVTALRSGDERIDIDRWVDDL